MSWLAAGSYFIILTPFAKEQYTGSSSNYFKRENRLDRLQIAVLEIARRPHRHRRHRRHRPITYCRTVSKCPPDERYKPQKDTGVGAG